MTDLGLLNPPQREAAEQIEGPVLILAGAGSGKTRALTFRMAHMIDMGIPAWSILAITFTNKAAKEMRQRVDALCGGGADEAWVMTFHACCTRILRRDIEKLGYKREFTIYDEDDKMVVIKRLIKELAINEKNYPPRSVRSVISDAKNRMLNPQEWLEENPDARSKPYYKLYEAYERTLKSNNALDFDDLLVKTLELLSQHPPVLESYQRKFKYIMVDEYQDTNAAQYQLVRLLSGENRNLCVVGDDDQSIYSWRGADIRNILSFENDFPGCKVIRLEENYRSTSTILDAANEVIAHNRARKAKRLWTQGEQGDRLRFFRALDEREEAAYVAENIQSRIREGVSPGEIAVLYRTNAQSRVLEEALVRKGIRYGVYGGLKFYDRKEVKDAIAYLRLLVNPADDVSLRRIINEPRRAIGDSTVDTLEAYARQEGISLLNAALACDRVGLGARAVSAVKGFTNLITSLLMKMMELSPGDFMQALIDDTGLIRQYENSKEPEDESRVENLTELVSAVTEYDHQNPDAGILGFLENVALVTDTDRLEEKSEMVTLMTLHSAKGLEFEAVFLVGLEEGIFPITRALMEETQLEEERRLMYVGMTRAKKWLYLCCAKSRFLFNQRFDNPVSRFVSEIPRELILSGRQAAGPARLGVANANQRLGAKVVTPGGAMQRTGGGAKMPLDGIPGVSKGFGARPQAQRSALFHAGDRVRHRSFGYGTVTEVRQEGKLVVVDFGERFGLKVMAADTAPMTLAEE